MQKTAVLFTVVGPSMGRPTTMATRPSWTRARPWTTAAPIRTHSVATRPAAEPAMARLTVWTLPQAP